MSIPDEYEGREQTYLKHQVLRRYLSKWGFKLGSTARHGPRRLWYVDCFAGPWRSHSGNVDDTSVSIGLAVLNEVVAEWRGRGAALSAEAIFVESDPRSHEALATHVEERRGEIQTHVLRGRFEAQVPAIQSLLGHDAAFIFVDPTGWKGAGMSDIAKLVELPYRDVMVNFMFDYINRFKGETQRAWLREQLRLFFGIEDNDALRDLDEGELLALYRRRLKETSGLTYALELAIPHPTSDRTYFHLVAGGRHRDVVELFRDVEAAVVGGEAADIRESARRRDDSQLDLGLETVPADDIRYRRLSDKGLQLAPERVAAALRLGPRSFEQLWPDVLEEVHITQRKLSDVILQMAAEGRLQIEGMSPRERTVKPQHRLRWTPAS